jgi:multidrug efflux pump
LFSRFFIDRPIFASVLSIVITLGGVVALLTLPLALYPPVSPPVVQIDAKYPGASAQVVAETVAAPIEQEVNGVEGMLYMSSQCTNDGSYNLTVTFQHGMDLNLAQVLVQTRAVLAMPRLPDVIKQAGITTRKRPPDILMAIALNSPDNRYDQLYLSNYALMHVAEELKRIPGVSDVSMLGQQDYSMRIWADPEKLASRDLSATDLVAAIREQNMPVATGQIGQPPAPKGQPIQVTLSTRGRLVTPEQFGNLVVKVTRDGRITRLKDVARIELGPKTQDLSCKVNGRPSVSLAVFQLPDANALDCADLVNAKMKELEKDFPPGLQYEIRYDTTPFIRESIGEVFKTLEESVILVAVVVLLFLQNWRSAVIPLLAVPVGIIGTFAVMAALGFSLNNLTLFGLVLAIGIVVDDAIVVVEAVEHHMERGLKPRAATIVAMDEVSGPVIAIGLVLSAVFIPCAFITGLVGQFFRQFALTIASSTLISTFNSLTLSPALAAMLLKPKPHGPHAKRLEPLPKLGIALIAGAAGYEFLTEPIAHQLETSGLTAAPSWAPALIAVLGAAIMGRLLARLINWILGWLFHGFNAGFRLMTGGYVRSVGFLLRGLILVLVVYGGLIYLTYHSFKTTPTGFVPAQDMGYLLINVQLPDSASLERTMAVMDEMEKVAHQVPGVKHTQAMAGQSFLLSAFGSNFGSMFIILDPYAERLRPEHYKPSDIDEKTGQLKYVFDKGEPDQAKHEELYPVFDSNKGDVVMGVPKPLTKQDLYGESIRAKLSDRFGHLIPDAMITVLGPPPVRGVGRAGGFKVMVEDRSGNNDLFPLQEQSDLLVRKARQTFADPSGVLSRPGTEFAEIHRGDLVVVTDEKAKEAGDLINKLRMADAKRKKADQTNGTDLKAALVALGKQIVQAILPPKNGDQPGPAAVVPSDTFVGMTSILRARVPQLYVDVNRSECLIKQVAIADLFTTLQVYLGSLYVNDFNLFGRTWQVIVQADAPFRDKIEDVKRLRVRNQLGQMVPIGSVAEIQEKPGPMILTRYNMYTAAPINGAAAPGVSSGQAMETIDWLAEEYLPPSMAIEWTELAYLERAAGNTAMYVFGFAVIMVFLVLAAQYESWALPLAVILVVPLCLLCSITGVNLAGQDINIFTQIGFVVLVGLACKNAILIVEFARAQRQTGLSRREAALAACSLRLRPIVMTSMAFILGVLPLLYATGAGAEMRQTLGTTVFSGMLGVTFFGILLTPVFFVLIDWLSDTKLFRSHAARQLGSVLLGVFALGYPRQVVRQLRARVAARRSSPWTEVRALVPDSEDVSAPEPKMAAPAPTNGHAPYARLPVNGHDGHAPAPVHGGNTDTHGHGRPAPPSPEKPDALIEEP